MEEPSQTLTQEPLIIIVVPTLRMLSFSSARRLIIRLMDSVVKGSEAASHVCSAWVICVQVCLLTLNQTQYTHFIRDTILPTPLWSSPSSDAEDVIAVSIDNSSVFIPGGNPNNTQYGFRRTELIAWKNSSIGELTAVSQINTTAFHFSIATDDDKPLNYTHEYQIVFIEPSDGSHVFGVQLGTHGERWMLFLSEC